MKVPRRIGRRRRPQKPLTPEGEVLHAIMQGLAAHRIEFRRMNSGATYAGGDSPDAAAAALPRIFTKAPRARRFIRYGFPGCPDLMVFWPGRGIGWIEVKSARGRLSEDQVVFRNLCLANHVVHVVARGWQDVAPHIGGHQPFYRGREQHGG